MPPWPSHDNGRLAGRGRPGNPCLPTHTLASLLRAPKLPEHHSSLSWASSTARTNSDQIRLSCSALGTARTARADPGANGASNDALRVAPARPLPERDVPLPCPPRAPQPPQSSARNDHGAATPTSEAVMGETTSHQGSPTPSPRPPPLQLPRAYDSQPTSAPAEADAHD